MIPFNEFKLNFSIPLKKIKKINSVKDKTLEKIDKFSKNENIDLIADGTQHDTTRHWYRQNVRQGQKVLIVLKKDQGTNKLTPGIVDRILTNSSKHTRGIKVRLKDGQVGRIQKILTK